MEDLLTNKNIVTLLNENIQFEDAKKLAYKQVFPCEYIPETAQEGLTYICFDVDIQSPEGKTFLFPTLYIWIFAHESKLRMPEGGIRTDKICSEISELINGSRRYGLGQLNLYSVRRFAPMTDYPGKVMTFKTKDYNRQYNGMGFIPTNRKMR